MKSAILSVAGLLAFAAVAQAGTYTIRIGDVDGFGYGDGAGYYGAPGGANNTNPANADGLGVLQTGDHLPDLNRNGVLATGAGDDFDNRTDGSNQTSNEKGNLVVETDHTTNNGSSGSKWTDISLSTSFHTSFPGATDFPDSGTTGDGIPNEPIFAFDFYVDAATLNTSGPVFFNAVFGDYDVPPAKVRFTFADGSFIEENLTTQPGGSDGLIQSAFASLTFDQVYGDTLSGGTYHGRVTAQLVAPNEPYTAWDFAEISGTQIALTQVPEPSSIALLGFGAALLIKRRRK